MSIVFCPLPSKSACVTLVGILTLIAFSFGTTWNAVGFSYVMAGARQPADTVVHPAGYTGSGGELNITIALHSDFEELEQDLEFTLKQAVQIWNDLLVASRSLSPSIEVPGEGRNRYFRDDDS